MATLGAYHTSLFRLACPLCGSKLSAEFDVWKRHAFEGIGNGVCDLEFAFGECCYDGGDCACPTCTHVSVLF